MNNMSSFWAWFIMVDIIIFGFYSAHYTEGTEEIDGHVAVIHFS